MITLEQDAIVVSMSDLQRFKRCRKAADLTYRQGLEPRADKESMAKGRAIHAIFEAFAITRMLAVEHNDKLYARLLKLKDALHQVEGIEELSLVASAYIEHEWDIEPERILNVEGPVYTLLLPKGAVALKDWVSPPVWLRTTFDMIFKDADDWVVGLDWKTFVNNVTMDVDLDFQGKIECVVLRKKYETDRARFEYRNIRQTPPNVKKDAKGGMWAPHECYFKVPLYPSQVECDMIWAETQEVAKDLLRCLGADNPAVWYRVDLKGVSPHTCGSCLVKELCKSEAMFGGLDAATIEGLAKPRNYTHVELPDGTKAYTEAPREFHPEEKVPA